VSGDYEVVAEATFRSETSEMFSTMSGLGLTLLTTIIGAFVGAYASSRFGYQQRAFAEEDVRRRAVADTALTALLELRRLLRSAETSRSSRDWAAATQVAYEALDDARHLLPPSLRHLKRSVRDSIGEAIGGVALSDLEPRMSDYELAPYDHKWTMYADDYLDLVIDTLRRWRDATRNKSLGITMMDFDAWLRATDRYQPPA
jgi:hypothetical protein